MHREAACLQTVGDEPQQVRRIQRGPLLLRDSVGLERVQAEYLGRVIDQAQGFGRDLGRGGKRESAERLGPMWSEHREHEMVGIAQGAAERFRTPTLDHEIAGVLVLQLGQRIHGGSVVLGLRRRHHDEPVRVEPPGVSLEVRAPDGSGVRLDGFPQLRFRNLLVALDLVEGAALRRLPLDDVQAVLLLPAPSVELHTQVVPPTDYLGDDPFEHLGIQLVERQQGRVLDRRRQGAGLPVAGQLRQCQFFCRVVAGVRGHPPSMAATGDGTRRSPRSRLQHSEFAEAESEGCDVELQSGDSTYAVAWPGEGVPGARRLHDTP
ncbi:hypothetical protein [Streptomyces sp. NPDC101234]|uniref:hypothetical protein n=1 Tax=Streptomyces sp. NPDC101234 TaxID=3366138 RepID=UPI0038191421